VLRRNLESSKNSFGYVKQTSHVLDIQSFVYFTFEFYNYTGDLTDEEDVRRIFHSTLTFYGRIDVLINNAGILEQGTIENTSLDQLDRMMKTNVRYVFI
jgi:NAD(P)-dependent dehydrogenase (short-subunit alcohol dehydrogenase family)